MEYKKNAKSISDILLMLQICGPVISDTGKTADFMKKVSYFRFAAYLRPLEIDKDSHIYPESRFMVTQIISSGLPQIEKILGRYMKVDLAHPPMGLE